MIIILSHRHCLRNTIAKIQQKFDTANISGQKMQNSAIFGHFSGICMVFVPTDTRIYVLLHALRHI